jgi:hypothetical protein
MRDHAELRTFSTVHEHAEPRVALVCVGLHTYGAEFAR